MKPVHRSLKFIMQELFNIHCNYNQRLNSITVPVMILNIRCRPKTGLFSCLPQNCVHHKYKPLPLVQLPFYCFAPCQHCGNLIQCIMTICVLCHQLKLILQLPTYIYSVREFKQYLVSRGMLLLSSQLSCALPES